jgi:hypothetical protein
MIPVKDTTFEVDSGFTGEKTRLYVSPGALVHIMDVLTNLYEDSLAAVIREYPVNALDSHIEAGNTNPIKITTPNVLSPLFIVEDEGVGLSLDELRDVYCGYGESTKRASNQVTGMLGLGSKSALAYTHQFIVEAIKSGVRVTAIISRTDDGAAEMQVIDTAATEKPNGVKISVAMSPSSALDSKIEDFFRWWEPGTVLVNGEAPKHALGDYDKLTTRLYVSRSNHAIHDGWHHLLVMGGVSYPVKLPDDIQSNIAPFKVDTVILAPIGSVSITPSREALNYENEATQRFIEQTFNGAYDAMIKQTGDDINKCATPFEAWKMASKWSNLNVSFKYKGKDIPKKIDQKYYRIWETKRSGVSNYYDAPESGDLPANGLFVVNCKKVGPYATGRINAWKMDKRAGAYDCIYVLVDGVSEWLDGAELHDYINIRKMFTPDLSKTRLTYYETYKKGHTYGKQSMELSAIKAFKNVIYEVAHNGPSYSRNDFPPDEHTVIVYISENRKAKLLREVPHAISVREFLEGERDRLRTKLSAVELDIISSPYLSNPPSGLDAGNYDDPDIKKWIIYTVARSPEGMKYEAVLVKLGEQVKKKNNPTDKYPMADSYSMKREHVIWYMNKYYNEVLKLGNKHSTY